MPACWTPVRPHAAACASARVGLLLLDPGGARQELRHEPHRLLLEDPGRLARRVLHDGAAGRVGGFARDPGEAQRGRVGPAGVSVVGGEESGAIGDERVELRAVRQPAGERRVGPALADDPRLRPVGRGPRADPARDRLEREVLVEAQLVEREAAAEQVQVAVDEPGDDATPPQLDDVRALAGELPHLGARADREDRRPPDSEGLGLRLRGIAGEDAAAEEDAVGLARLLGGGPGHDQKGEARDREGEGDFHHGRDLRRGRPRQGAGRSVRTWTLGPGRNGVRSPFAHAAWPSA